VTCCPLAEASPVLAGLVGASVRRLGDEPDLGHLTSRGPRQALSTASQRLALDLELHDPPRDLIELRRHRIDLRPEPRRRFIGEVDGLVTQEAIGDVPVREHRRRHERGVLDAHAVMDLVALLEPAEDRVILHRRLVHHDRLEPALERRVLLDVLSPSGKSPRTMRWAGPSTMAVLPTPEAPISTPGCSWCGATESG
jgi:hypothetical protein